MPKKDRIGTTQRARWGSNHASDGILGINIRDEKAVVCRATERADRTKLRRNERRSALPIRRPAPAAQIPCPGADFVISFDIE